jgi:hypothetical protein
MNGVSLTLASVVILGGLAATREAWRSKPRRIEQPARGSRGIVRRGTFEQAPELLAITNEAGRAFNVRVVRKGDGYGVDDALVYPDPDAKSTYEQEAADRGDVLVEFYDATDAGDPYCGPRGQFVSRYYLSTLKESSGYGLDLAGGAWQITAKNRQEAIAFAERRRR